MDEVSFPEMRLQGRRRAAAGSGGSSRRELQPACTVSTTLGAGEDSGSPVPGLQGSVEHSASWGSSPKSFRLASHRPSSPVSPRGVSGCEHTRLLGTLSSGAPGHPFPAGSVWAVVSANAEPGSSQRRGPLSGGICSWQGVRSRPGLPDPCGCWSQVPISFCTSCISHASKPALAPTEV